MSGSTPTGSPPPEVPEEFAAAYRAAYEKSLRAQDEARPVEPESEPTPEPQSTPESEWTPESESSPEPLSRGDVMGRLQSTTVFMPVLLVLVALVLILGAYAIGRGWGQLTGLNSLQFQFSRTIVTGPSLTSSTAMTVVPASIDLPWSKNVNDEGIFKSDGHLKVLYAEAGMDDGKKTVALCRIDERSYPSALALRLRVRG